MRRCFAFAGTACAAILCAAVAVLAGCAASGGGIPSSGPIAVHPRPDAGMDALLEGTLRTEGGCVRIEADGSVAVPSFPVGDASWTGDTLTWRGEDYVDGDSIALGGGFMGTASHPADGGYMPKGCVGLEIFVVSPF